MAREGRIGRARERLRSLRDARSASADAGSPGSEGPKGAGVDEPSAGPVAPEPERGPAAGAGDDARSTGIRAGESDSAPDSQLSIGDIGDGRRESVARRLRALRERGRRSAGAGPASGASDSRVAALRARLGEASTGAGGLAGSLRKRAAGGAGNAAKEFERARAGVTEAWSDTPLVVRQRIAAGAIVALAAAVVLFVLVPAAPCGVPGGDDCPPPDDAIALVPGDALAYAHLDIDPDSSEFAAASALSERLPLLSALLTQGVLDVGGRTIDPSTQIRPWAGGEAALALLPGAVSPDRVTMIEADDVDGAREFAAGALGPNPRTEEINGIEATVGRGDVATAMLSGFLLIGDLDGVERMLAPAADDGSLESSAGASVLDGLPVGRVAYAYLSAEGARLLAQAPAATGLDTFVDSEASTGVGVSVEVEGARVSATLESDLDPDLVEASPGFFSALPDFEPTLSADVGAETLAYLGLGDPETSVRSLLQRAAITTPALLSAFNRAAETLRRQGGVSVVDDLLPLLGSEAALTVEPVAGSQSSETPGVLDASGVPYVSLIAKGLDSESAAAALADLQDPLVSALAPSRGEAAGQVAVFEPLQIAGIEAQSLAISPNVRLTYATYDDRLVAATNPLGIAEARAGGDGLADSEGFRQVTGDLPQSVSVLAYLDLRDLIALGEQVGLATDPGYAALASDLRALEAAAVSVASGDDVIRTDLRLTVGEGAPAPVDPTLAPGQ